MAVDIRVPFEGLKYMLEQLATIFGTMACSVRLYKSSYSPNSSSTYAAISANEADFSGYSGQSMSTPSVQAAADGSGRAWATVSQVTFSHNGGGTSNTIGGFYITKNSDSKLLYWAPLDTPKTMSASGHEIKVTPALTNKSEF